jgi:hypothetical protein
MSMGAVRVNLRSVHTLISELFTGTSQEDYPNPWTIRNYSEYLTARKANKVQISSSAGLSSNWRSAVRN